jgi:hypothetical protein
VHEPALRGRLLDALAEQPDLVAHARAPELADAQRRLDVSGNASAALNVQCDSAHRPIASPPWMSRPPSPISQALITVSKNA